MTEAAPINLEKGSGTFVFTQAGVDVQDVTGRVEGNAFNINGHLTGYSPDAPFSVRIKSLPGDTLKIPASPPYLNAMPGIVREIYSLMRPDGICTMAVRVDRPTPGSRPLIDGQVEVVDGTFATIFFPYTLRQVHGQVAFGWNESAQADFVRIVNMRGRGNADGPNRDKWLAVNGEVGPLGPGISGPHVEIRIDGKNIESEPPLMAAFPPEVKGPLKLFDADHTGRSPTFRGDFHTTVLHHAGASWRWTFDTDVNIHDASGKLVGFPYPLEHVAARLQVRDGYLDVIDARMVRDGSTTMRVDGRVSWGAMTPPHSPPSQDGVRADLKVAVRDLAIDKELLAALPPEAGARIKSIGIGGRIDVDGHVFTGANDPARPAGAPFSGDDVRFDLGVALRHGTMWPAEGTFSASDVSGRFHLTRDAIEILAMHGRRGAGELDAEGAITSPGGEPEVALHVKAKALPLDGPLYALLPATARRAWDEVQPQGGVDAEVTYRGPVGGDPPRRDDAIAGGPAPTLGGLDAPAHSTAPPSTPSAPGAIALSPASMVGAAPPASIAPAPHAVDRTSASIPSGFRVTLKPRGLACTIKSVPYALHDLTGTINVTPEGVTITDVSARHGDATITVSGTGSTAEHPVWDLKLSGKHVPVDDDLRKALPAGMLSVVDAVKLRGNVDFDFPRFVYRGDGFLNGDAAATQPTPATTPATTAVASSRPAPCVTPPRPAEIDLASTINFNRCTLDLGVPLEDLGGQIRMAATVRDGRLAALRGDLDIAHVAMGTRHLTDFHTTLEKPADRTELYLDKMHGRLAGGNVAGQVHLSFPDVGPSKYVLAFVVRNADLQALVGDAERDIKGELTANMSLEGVWGDASLRRGRGDVIVTGKELYHIPLVMGLLQMTNLTLPIATPFKVGDARYSVAGQRVNFEQVQLKSDNMMMLGAGFLDFKSKQVRMTFTTDNPGGFKVPFLNDIWQGARGELFKLSIKGTIQEPKVEANPFATLTTTVDEVFKEDGKRK